MAFGKDVFFPGFLPGWKQSLLRVGNSLEEHAEALGLLNSSLFQDGPSSHPPQCQLIRR